MLQVKFGKKGSPSFSRMIGVAQNLIKDFSPVFNEVVHPWMLRHMAFQFHSGGRHGGEAWDEYTGEPQYKAFKKAITGHLKPLLWTPGMERLRPSLVSVKHPEHVWIATKNRVRFGTLVPYAEDLLEGGVNPFGESYPGRNMFAMTEGQASDLRTRMQRRIVDMIKANDGSMIDNRSIL